MRLVQRAVDVPVVVTERLVLRGHRLDDLRASLAMWSDPLVTRHIGGTPSSEEQTWARLLRYVGHWSLLGFGYWAVEEKTSGSFVGEVGFAEMKREIDPPLEDVPEVGWALISAAHGKGYATEAVRAALAWGDAHFASGRSLCLIHPDNAASLRVAEKCGYRESHRTTYKGTPAIVFARESP